jgi:hypothetical protein
MASGITLRKEFELREIALTVSRLVSDWERKTPVPENGRDGLLARE